HDPSKQRGGWTGRILDDSGSIFVAFCPADHPARSIQLLLRWPRGPNFIKWPRASPIAARRTRNRGYALSNRRSNRADVFGTLLQHFAERGKRRPRRHGHSVCTGQIVCKCDGGSVAKRRNTCPLSRAQSGKAV